MLVRHDPLGLLVNLYTVRLTPADEWVVPPRIACLGSVAEHRLLDVLHTLLTSLSSYVDTGDPTAVVDGTALSVLVLQQTLFGSDPPDIHQRLKYRHGIGEHETPNELCPLCTSRD